MCRPQCFSTAKLVRRASRHPGGRRPEGDSVQCGAPGRKRGPGCGVGAPPPPETPPTPPAIAPERPIRQTVGAKPSLAWLGPVPGCLSHRNRGRRRRSCGWHRWLQQTGRPGGSRADIQSIFFFLTTRYGQRARRRGCIAEPAAPRSAPPGLNATRVLERDPTRPKGAGQRTNSIVVLCKARPLADIRLASKVAEPGSGSRAPPPQRQAPQVRLSKAPRREAGRSP